MSTNLIPFFFEDHGLRVIMQNDDPWFVAVDVCRILEVANSRDAVSRLDGDEKGVASTDTLGGQQQTNIVSEGGLYTLILRSRDAMTPGTVAHRFRKWVTAELLPTLRRTGRYEMAGIPEPETGPSIFDGMSHRTLSLNIQAIDLVRKIRGNAAADVLLSALLPMLDGTGPKAPGRKPARVEEGHACLAHILNFELDGAAVDDHLRNPSKSVLRMLASLGLRPMPTNRLFISNQTHGALFHGSRWAGGLHQSALRAIPGTYLHRNPLTLNGLRSRGVIVPLFAEISHAN